METPLVELTPEIVASVFPFHLAIDRDMNIMQAGSAIRGIDPAVVPKTPARESFLLVRPQVPFEINAIREQSGELFVLESVRTGARLGGQMLCVPSSDILLFLASPWIADVADMRKPHFALQEFAIHYPVEDFLFLLDSKNTALRDLEDLTKQLGHEQARLEQRNRHLVTGYAITQLLSEAVTMTEAIPEVLRVIGETLDWDFGTFWSWDSEACALRCGSTWSGTPERFDAFESANTRLFASGDGWPGRIFLRDESVWIPDLAAESRDVRTHAASQAGLSTMFGFPFKIAGQTAGVVEFFSSQLRAVDTVTLNMMFSITAKIDLFGQRLQVEEERRRYEKDLAAAKSRLELQALELLHAGEKLGRARDAAIAANELKSQFVAHVSHEMRTPMNGILGLTEIVLQGELSEDQRENLSLVQKSAESLVTLLNDILDFSKIEAGKLDIENIPFALRETLRAVLRPIEIRAASRSLQMTLSVDGDVPDMVRGDQGRLRQILTNLAGNSLKFTKTGGVSVHVQAQSIDSERLLARFSVRDTGIGIPLEKQAAIFEAFTQAERSTARKYGGTGLGLSISARLAELMGSRIELESEPGKGSTFSFTIALGIGGSASGEAAASHPAPIIIPEGLRILVAEDNPINQTLAVRMLEKYKHRVTLARDGVEALQILERQTFDLVLMDVQMPEMDGLAATAAIRAKEHPGGTHLPIVAMTACALKGDEARFLKAGMDGYVSKPIHLPELFRAIEAARSHSGQPSLSEPSVHPE